MSVREQDTRGLRGIRRARKNAGLTQAQLAKKLGVFRETIASYECGTGNPSLTMLRRIAGALGVTIDELLREDAPEQSPASGDQPSPPPPPVAQPHSELATDAKQGAA